MMMIHGKTRMERCQTCYYWWEVLGLCLMILKSSKVKVLLENLDPLWEKANNKIRPYKEEAMNGVIKQHEKLRDRILCFLHSNTYRSIFTESQKMSDSRQNDNKYSLNVLNVHIHHLLSFHYYTTNCHYNDQWREHASRNTVVEHKELNIFPWIISLTVAQVLVTCHFGILKNMETHFNKSLSLFWMKIQIYTYSTGWWAFNTLKLVLNAIIYLRTSLLYTEDGNYGRGKESKRERERESGNEKKNCRWTWIQYKIMNTLPFAKLPEFWRNPPHAPYHMPCCRNCCRLQRNPLYFASSFRHSYSSPSTHCCVPLVVPPIFRYKERKNYSSGLKRLFRLKFANPARSNVLQPVFTSGYNCLLLVL